MKNIYLKYCWLLLFVLPQISYAQLQKTDSTFIVSGGTNSTVRNIHIQSNGKIIITGDFNVYQGKLGNRIARINPNGLVDTTFRSGFGSEGPIRASAILPNDQIVIGGLFNSYNNIARKNIAKVNSNGSLDTTFAKGAGANNEITDMIVQGDGKILITGFFSKYNNVNFNGFLRLTSSGEIDTSFKIGTGTNLSPYSFAQQSNHKIILVGNFSSYNGVPRSKIVRINIDGSLDTTFVNNPVSNIIQKVLVLANDDIIITGGFTNIGGVTKTGIAKLHKDGSLDTAFKAYVLGTIRSLHLQKDGKIIIAGDIYNVNGKSVQKLARINEDGTLDNSFFAGFNGTIYGVAEQTDRKIIVGGAFTQTTMFPSGLINTNRIVRLENYYCLEGSKPILSMNSAKACANENIQLSIIGGNLNDAKTWYLYEDSCNNKPIDSGSIFTISSASNKTYYVRPSPVCFTDLSKCVKFDLNITPLNSGLYVDSMRLISLDSGANFQWYSCDSNWQILSGETNSVFVPQVSGSYALVIERDGCIDTSECVNFKVLNVGLNKFNELRIKNPVINELVFPEAMKEVSIISSLGSIVYSSKYFVQTIDVNQLSKGTYFIRCLNQSGKHFQSRILIQ